MKTELLIVILLALFFAQTQAQNPVFKPNIGVCDPHIKIFNNKAYMYATHDFSFDNTEFVMKDWWI